MGWLKFGCKFSSKWLSFGCHSTVSKDKQAITLKSVNDEFNADYRKILLEWIGIGTVLTALLSALAYGLGSLTAWVIKGFKKKEL